MDITVVKLGGTEGVDFSAICKDAAELLNQGKRLVFVLHHCDEEHHPLWDQITSGVGGLPEIDLEYFIQTGKNIKDFQFKADELNPKTLPPLKRWWRLSDGRLLAKRQSESFSSLEAFIKSPYQWVLRYKAKLESGSLAALPKGNLLNGTLVHRLIEDFFETHQDCQTIDEKKFQVWLDRRMPELIEQEGAVHLGSGRAVEHEAFKEFTRRGLSALLNGIKGANVKAVEVESLGSCKFVGGDLLGYIDLLLKDASGRELVLDVKWAGSKYREDDLRKNMHLQLAIYAWMRKCMTNSSLWPPQAFFLIEEAHFLSQNRDAFSNAVPCPARDGESTADLWRRFEETWKWRREQLDRGLVEITITGTDPDDESKPPESGLVLDDNADRFNDFAVLTGWEEGA